jgi:hypothetical protein
MAIAHRRESKYNLGRKIMNLKSPLVIRIAPLFTGHWIASYEIGENKVVFVGVWYQSFDIALQDVMKAIEGIPGE